MASRQETECFLGLLTPHRGVLERYARRMLRDASRLDDVLQDAVLAALERFEQFDQGTNFRAWIFRFVMFGVLNANRKHEPVRLSEIPTDLEWEEDFAAAEAVNVFEDVIAAPFESVPPLEDAMQNALARLTAPERACLLLRAIGEFDYHEIHEILDMPRGSVMGYLSRARKRMRLFLAEYAREYGWSSGAGDTATYEPGGRQGRAS